MGDRNMSVNSNIWQNKIHFIDVNLLVCSLMHGHRTYIYIYIVRYLLVVSAFGAILPEAL